MSQLNDNLTEILRQKNAYLLPENLKKDVTVLGITGTYEGGSGSGDVKLFDTVEHMQADTNPQEGDLAVVYREEIQPVTEESEFSSCIFPNTVVLDEAFEDEIYGSFRAIDQSVMFDGMVDMSSSNFRFNGYGDSSEIRIQYSSQDGITYTRTDGGEELQEFGTTIKWEPNEEFNNVIGKFMKISGNYFEGLYEYKTDTENNAYITNIDYDGTNVTYNANTKIPFDINVYSRGYLYVIETERNNGEPLTVTAYPCHTVTQDITNNKLYVCGGNGSGVPSSTNTITVKHIDLSTGNRTEETLTSSYIMTTTNSYVRTYNEITGKKWFYIGSDSIQIFTTDGTTSGLLYINGQPEYYETKYFMAATQLNATLDYVYGKTFYGKNGVENGTLTTNVSNSFADANAELVYKIKQQYDNMQPRVLTDQDKEIDKNIYFIPTKYNGTLLLDTSNVTNMRSMFSGCTNLIAIPLIDTSNATNMHGMFSGCTSLTTIPLLDTSNVTDMCEMFYYCVSLTTVPLLDTSNATNTDGMFFNCKLLTTIPLLDTSDVTNMQNMFGYCTNLTTIPLIDTSSVIYMNSMFSGCTNLTNIPQLNTSNVTNMRSMFSGCTSLTTIPLIDTSSVTDMYYMFSNCTSLTAIPLIDTSSVTDMSQMFGRCTSLTTVPQLDISSATSIYYMFVGCSNLSNESLNNILAICITATSVSSSWLKSLKSIGLTQEQAQICTTLSNYSAFTAAGWTTGY